MKKLLLTILFFIPILAFSQKLIQGTSTSEYTFYDASTKQYLDKKAYMNKNGGNSLVMLVFEAFTKGEINKDIVPLILGDKYYIKDGKMVDEIQGKTILTPDIETTQIEYINMTSMEKKKSSIKMRPVNLTIGCSVIGLSAAGYMIASSAINDKIKNNGKRGAELDAMIQKEQSQSKPNAGKLDGYTNELKELADKSTKLNKNRSTVGYICGATSIVGIVVIITGLHRDSKGVPVAHNTYINSNNNGLSASIMF